MTASRRIARNAPCWCGSGEKYKRCHLQADEARERERWRRRTRWLTGVSVFVCLGAGVAIGAVMDHWAFAAAGAAIGGIFLGLAWLMDRIRPREGRQVGELHGQIDPKVSGIDGDRS